MLISLSLAASLSLSLSTAPILDWGTHENNGMILVTLKFESNWQDNTSFDKSSVIQAHHLGLRGIMEQWWVEVLQSLYSNAKGIAWKEKREMLFGSDWKSAHKIRWVSLFCCVWLGFDQCCNHFVLKENMLADWWTLSDSCILTQLSGVYFWFFHLQQQKKPVVNLFMLQNTLQTLQRKGGSIVSPCYKRLNDLSHECIQESNIAMDSVVDAYLVTNTWKVED